MSPNPYPIFSVSQSDKPEQIKEKIRMLIQLYIQDPNSFTADAVANHIAAILHRPKYINNIEQRCLFRQLEKHWRCLAWIKHTPLFPTKKEMLNLSIKTSRI